MKIEVLKEFHSLFTERCNKYRIIDIREDSLRYDFFFALTKVENLRPSDLQLEAAINKEAFIERKNSKSKRKESPMLDLVVSTKELKINVEFGLFRQNSNDKGNINKTARTVKFLNDMIRLGLDHYYTKRKSFFICVADDKMLKHQLRSKSIGSFPSDYKITKKIIEDQLKTKTNYFDYRFLSKLFENKLEINAELIFNENIESFLLRGEVKILVWEIKVIKN